MGWLSPSRSSASAARVNCRLGAVAGLSILLLGAARDPLLAQGSIDRIGAKHILRCDAEARPGLAELQNDGKMTGLAVDLCRAIAIAAVGPAARVEMSLHRADNEFDALRSIDVAFLSAAAIADNQLASAVLPGPVVYIDPIAMMVPEASSARSLKDLEGRIVCLMIGSPVQRALEAWLHRRAITVGRLTFEEDVELLDAYNVGGCDAVVDYATRLAEMRRATGVNRRRSRIIEEPLALSPFLAVTPVGDGEWSARVAWILQAVIAADSEPSPWRVPEMPATGLRPGWRQEVESALGTYGSMRDRHLGEHSPLGLVIWPNAPWPAGLLLPITNE
jgi:general L-amino acid transport system substrate-binding protein